MKNEDMFVVTCGRAGILSEGGGIKSEEQNTGARQEGKNFRPSFLSPAGDSHGHLKIFLSNIDVRYSILT
jgi:hypothetical protein